MSSTTQAVLSPTSDTDIKITQSKAIIFDVYATLVDWESGIHQALMPILPSTSPTTSSSNPASRIDALTAFQSIERSIQVENPTMLYRDVLAATHAELLKRAGFSATDKEAGGSTAKDGVSQIATGEDSTLR